MGIGHKSMQSYKLKHSKTPLLRPPLSLRKNGLYSGVDLILSSDKEEINVMGL